MEKLRVMEILTNTRQRNKKYRRSLRRFYRKLYNKSGVKRSMKNWRVNTCQVKRAHKSKNFYMKILKSHW